MTDRPGRIQALGADIDTVLDSMTAKYTERVIQVCEALLGRSIPAIGKKAIGLQQTGRPDETVGVPPEGWAAGRTARAEDALI